MIDELEFSPCTHIMPYTSVISINHIMLQLFFNCPCHLPNAKLHEGREDVCCGHCDSNSVQHRVSSPNPNESIIPSLPISIFYYYGRALPQLCKKCNDNGEFTGPSNLVFQSYNSTGGP